MRTQSVCTVAFGSLAAAIGFLAPTYAFAVAQTPSISGNAWAAIGILVGLIALIFLTVVVALGLFRRDAKRGVRDDTGGGWWGSEDD